MNPSSLSVLALAFLIVAAGLGVALLIAAAIASPAWWGVAGLTACAIAVLRRLQRRL